MHHPFHLHGHRFLVKNMGQYKDQRMTVELAKAIKIDQGIIGPRSAVSRPPFKDTISIPSYGFATFRFLADNPGFWLIHCHYEWHMNIGMAMVIQVGEPDEMVPPPEGFPQCGNFMPDI